MKPFGFALGALTGAAAVLLLNRQGTQRVRPIAKAAMKAAVMAYHEARVQGAELAEAAEDLFAEAKAELDRRGTPYWSLTGVAGPQAQQLFLRDPHGNMIELYQVDQCRCRAANRR